uniref:Major facilitator superfamily (MFS) profile domain-containing protein n=1 Tax=Cucumis melo TaxID=3656 RepID=A0A9I9D0H8_CUCME
MEEMLKLTHLLVTVFLYTFATMTAFPAIPDVTMSALCPGRDECSLAIYFTGFQQVVTGVGALLMVPLLGNLSDKFGRKTVLTIPLILNVIPLGILGYGRSRDLFYIYFVFKCVTSIVCEGSVQCLAVAYAADNVPEHRRASAFGILSAIISSASVCGNLCARFLSISSTFQAAASTAAMAALYMRVFLTDSASNCNLSAPLLSGENVESVSSKKEKYASALPSLTDLFSFLKTSSTFSQAAVVAFFSNLADVGHHASIMMLLHSLAWSEWLQSIVSKQVGASEQGKAQGCISGISSFANVVSPFVFSPLTALFLSENAPFYFPGFSIMCAASAAKTLPNSHHDTVLKRE